MSIEIKVPVLPESITDATVATWHKKVGEFIKRDEQLVDIETDKVILEVVAPDDGIVEKIMKTTGSKVTAHEVIGLFKAQVAGASTSSGTGTQISKGDAPTGSTTTNTQKATPAPSKPAAQKAPTFTAPTIVPPTTIATVTDSASPSLRRRLSEMGKANNTQATNSAGSTSTKISNSPADSPPGTAKPAPAYTVPLGKRLDERVPMSRIRARIAERLLQAQQNAAILTTFNEINMQGIMQLREKYKETFEKTYGVRLGLMSFFVKAVVQALKQFPIINASVDGTDIVYHGYFDIGIAVASPRGLVVPVLRDADTLTMPQIESEIANYAKKAKDGQLTIEEMSGGTFTITNGGVFGSLMSTPIINPPQSAILGMHKIEERPMVEQGKVVVKPMMYVAMSYDHRIIDGADSVRFLVAVKEELEDPARILIGV